jgi:hypothetical protein
MDWDIGFYVRSVRKTVQYVKICSLYGAGFFYVPGTDTCLKIGGFVRAEMNFNANTSFAQFNRQNLDTRNKNFSNTRVRFAITADARTQTAYGTLRSYLLIAEQADTGTPSSNAGFGVGGSDVRTWSNAAFIQLAGFTAGLTTSFFDFDTFAYSNQTNVLGSSWAGAGVPVFAYTAQFGNGWSATISAEGGGGEGRRSHILAAVGGAGSNAGYAGREVPNFVGNLRVDQAWGSAQVMGAVHQVRPNTYDLSGFGDAPGDEWGYAFGGGLKLNLGMFGPKDYAIVQATYTKGALAYVGSGLAGIAGAGATPAYLIQTGVGAGLASAYGPVFDATYGPTGDLDLTTAWSITGGFEHHWNAQWRTSIYGAHGHFDYGDVSSARIAAFPVAAGGIAGGRGSADWSLSQIGSRTVFNPVANLDLSVDVMYNKVSTAFSDAPGFEDKGWWSGMFRVQRNFYP